MRKWLGILYALVNILLSLGLGILFIFSGFTIEQSLNARLIEFGLGGLCGVIGFVMIFRFEITPIHKKPTDEFVLELFFDTSLLILGLCLLFLDQKIKSILLITILGLKILSGLVSQWLGEAPFPQERLKDTPDAVTVSDWY